MFAEIVAMDAETARPVELLKSLLITQMKLKMIEQYDTRQYTVYNQ